MEEERAVTRSRTLDTQVQSVLNKDGIIVVRAERNFLRVRDDGIRVRLRVGLTCTRLQAVKLVETVYQTILYLHIAHR